MSKPLKFSLLLSLLLRLFLLMFLWVFCCYCYYCCYRCCCFCYCCWSKKTAFKFWSKSNQPFSKINSSGRFSVPNMENLKRSLENFWFFSFKTKWTNGIYSKQRGYEGPKYINTFLIHHTSQGKNQDTLRNKDDL